MSDQKCFVRESIVQHQNSISSPLKNGFKHYPDRLLSLNYRLKEFLETFRV